LSTKKLQVLGTFGTIDGKTASDFLNTITLTTVFDENFNVLATTDATVILDGFATDYQDNAKYVFIPSSVTEVSPGAFYYCTNITDVFIDNVKGGVDVDSFMVVDQLGHTTEIWPFSTSTNLHYVQGSNTLIGLLLQINSKSGDSITDVYTKTEVDDALDKKANTDEVENSLAEKETIDNKITDKRFITDSKANYPSIAFLENYFYNIDEADELLDKKANSADVGTALAQKANATDVYEVISVKNILNISPYTNTVNGITVTVDANNHITISGTASKYTLIQDIPINCILETGAKYTLSTQNSAKLGTNDSSVSIALGGHTSTSILTINYEGLDNSKTFTAEADAEFLLLQVASEKTVNVECDIQLEKGEEYTEFIPPNAVEGYISKLSLQDGSVSKEKLNEELQNKIDVIPKMNYLYVSLDYQEDEEGFGETKFNSILDANNSITDNDEFNRYTIIVKAGTYNEFEERYAGSTDTSKLQGIETKNYVYYESENINNPSECILSWDGVFGYEEGTLTDAMAVKKCIFHIKGGGYLEEGMHTHIKGFTITSKNTRYGLHIESGGYGRNVNWLVENCIIEYGGRPNIANSVLQPVLGMGMSPFECGEIRKCVIKYSDDTTWNSDTDTPKAIVCHNNSDATVYANKPPVIVGAELNIKDCKFNDNTVTFSTKTNTVLSDTKFTVHLDNNVGISSVDNSEAWLLTDGQGERGIDGVDGIDGLTPVKGVDYWTETEQAEIIQEIQAAVESDRVAPLFVDDISKMTDPSELYVLTTDGNLYNYATKDIPSYTNLFDPSTASLNKRVKTDGTVIEFAGMVTSAKIPLSSDGSAVTIPGSSFNSATMKLRFRGADWVGDDVNTSPQCSVHFYDSSGTYITKVIDDTTTVRATLYANKIAYEIDENGDKYIYLQISDSQGLYSIENACYFDISLKVSDSTITIEDVQDIILTLDEPIVYEQIYEWSVMRAYQSASYEQRICNIESSIQDLTAIINNGLYLKRSGALLSLMNGTKTLSTVDLPYEIIGLVGDNNDILLSGTLPPGTYTLKYENADGYSEIGTIEVS
jgi:hypothetical protein